MIRRMLPLFIAIAVAWPAATSGQGEKPNFSGSWKLERQDTPPGVEALGTEVLAGREGRPGDKFGVAAATLVVKRGATDMTVVSTTGKGFTATEVYKLDGSEHVTGASGIFDRSMTRARWDGPTLVVYIYQSMQQRRDIWSLNGDLLTLERVLGGGGLGAGPHKLVYRRMP